LYCPKDRSLVAKTKEGKFHCARCNKNYDYIEVYQNPKQIAPKKAINGHSFRDVINDISTIFRPIGDLGLKEEPITDPRIASFYERAVAPNLQAFKAKYEMSPDEYLGLFISRYLGNKAEDKQYVVETRPGLRDNRLCNGVSAFIGRKDDAKRKKPGSHLFVWAGYDPNDVISFGFDYEDKVTDDSPSVRIVKEDKELRNMIERVPRKNRSLLVGYNKSEDTSFQYYDVDEIGEFTKDWNCNYSLMGGFLQNEVSEDIETVIIEALDDLWPIFEKISRA